MPDDNELPPPPRRSTRIARQVAPDPSQLPLWAVEHHVDPIDSKRTLIYRNFPPALDPATTPNLWDLRSSCDGRPLAQSDAERFLAWLATELRKDAAHVAMARVGSARARKLVARLQADVEREQRDDTDGVHPRHSLLWRDLADFDLDVDAREDRIELVELLFEAYLFPNLTDIGHDDWKDAPSSAINDTTKSNAWSACATLSQALARTSTSTSTAAASVNRLARLPAKVQRALDLVFRVDTFGNVISIFAHQYAACGVHYDHYFPRARGGRTNDLPHTKGRTNIVCVQHSANVTKGQRLVGIVCPLEEYRLGISVHQFMFALGSKQGMQGVPLVEYALGTKAAERIPRRASIAYSADTTERAEGNYRAVQQAVLLIAKCAEPKTATDKSYRFALRRDVDVTETATSPDIDDIDAVEEVDQVVRSLHGLDLDDDSLAAKTSAKSLPECVSVDAECGKQQFARDPVKTSAKSLPECVSVDAESSKLQYAQALAQVRRSAEIVKSRRDSVRTEMTTATMTKPGRTSFLQNLTSAFRGCKNGGQ